MRKQEPQREMTEEERLLHEQYLQELMQKNVKSAKLVGAILWCLGMAAWALLIVLDFRYEVGPTKILFHGAGALLTACIAIPHVRDLVAVRKKAQKAETNPKEDTEA